MDSNQLKLKKDLVQHLLDRKNKEIAAFKNVQERRLDSIDVEAGEAAEWYETNNDEVARKVELSASSLEELSYDTNLLRQLEVDETMEDIQFGSVVETDNGNFFVAIPATDMEVGGKTFTGVSVKSPFFQAILEKKVGDSVSFRDRDYKILAIY